MDADTNPTHIHIIYETRPYPSLHFHVLLPTKTERKNRVTRIVYRAAVFDITTAKHPQHPPLYYVPFIRPQGKKAVCSTVILETQATWNLPSTTVSVVVVAQLSC